MNEGWNGDEYLILFEEGEIVSASDRYAISEFLPGFQVIGLRGWDDLIVRDSAGRIYCVPTVPAVPKCLSPLHSFPKSATDLKPDERFRNVVKWYVTPIAFGGDPNIGSNVIWVSHEQHAQLVRFWNDRYRSVGHSSDSQ